jgi:hypothetical protein
MLKSFFRNAKTSVWVGEPRVASSAPYSLLALYFQENLSSGRHTITKEGKR